MFIDAYRWNNVRILEIIRESADAVTIVVERPELYTFKPGQHAIIRCTMLDGTTRVRQYSFANSPHLSQLYFTITRSPGGDVSNWMIDNASTSSTIEISQAFTGPLQVDLSTYRSVAMIGGGSGIVPLMCQLRTLRSLSSPINIHLAYSTRSTFLCYDSELQSATPSEHIVLRQTDTEPRLSERQIANHIKTGEVILICGSRKFVTEMQQICQKYSPHTPIYAEAFSLA